MTRPLLATIASQAGAWDGDIDGNFNVLTAAPIPLHQDPALTESTLAATFPAASYAQCTTWVNHSVLGYVLYSSDGTNWYLHDVDRREQKSITAAGTISNTETARHFFYGGTLPYSVNLRSAASLKGRTEVHQTVVAGTLTLVAPTGTINGAGSITITVQYAGLSITSDGTNYFAR